MKWFLVFFSAVSLQLFAHESVHRVKVELELICPHSEELQTLIDTFSYDNEDNISYEEWAGDLKKGMNELEILLDSKKIYQGSASFTHDIEPK